MLKPVVKALCKAVWFVAASTLVLPSGFNFAAVSAIAPLDIAAAGSVPE